MVEQHQKHISPITLKAREETGALMASVEQAGKEGEELKEKREAATRDLGLLCKENKCVEYERDGSKAK